MQLFHNFTYFLNDPENGDQFEQFENRWTTGAKLTHRRLMHFGEKHLENVFGVDLRNDSVGGPLGLYATRSTERIATVRADDVNQTSLGVFGDSEIEWNRWARTTVGLRGDIYNWRVTSDNPLNSGQDTSGILSPKVSTVFGPWKSTEFYANWGWGFHSNSGLGVVLSVDPATGDPVAPSTPFARSKGAEFGVRNVAVRKLQTTATFWYLDFDSELIYVGDSGSTEAGPPSRRYGLEFTNYVYPNPWVAFDLDLSFSHARFLDVPEDEAFVPGALNRVISGGIAVNPPAGVRKGPFAGFRLRHFGPRPLIEDGSVKSKSTTIFNGEAGYKFSEQYPADARGLQPLRCRGVGHRLLLRVALAGRAGAGRRHSLPCGDSAIRTSVAAGLVLVGRMPRSPRNGAHGIHTHRSTRVRGSHPGCLCVAASPISRVERLYRPS